VARFFPEARIRLALLFRDVALPERVAEAGACEPDDASLPSGRNQGFRRKVLEIYDYQCAACGLRINIPDVLDGTYVDAAHLIPFSESRNDHPTSARTTTGRWIVSSSRPVPTVCGTHRNG
jgi:putative restriction endonuclease